MLLSAFSPRSQLRLLKQDTVQRIACTRIIMKSLLFFLGACVIQAPVFLGQTNVPGRTFLPSSPYTTTPSSFSFTTQTSPAPTSATSGSYLLTTPLYAIPGFNFSLGFESFVNTPIQMNARIYETTYDNILMQYRTVNIVTTSTTVNKGQPQMIHLPVPENLRQSGSYLWEVSCDACGLFPYYDASRNPGTRFVQGSLPVEYDVTTIFVQTDKAIYKPGQMVHFRVFAIYPDLKMYTGLFQIDIKDPNGNKIQHLSDASGHQGVVEGSLGLADQPVLGDWMISVEIQTTTRSDQYNKAFTVAEYQLPRFEVIVDIPSYILTSDENLQGTVTATYTFGQPVKGMVELHVSPNTGLDYCGKEPRFMQLAFDINGEAKFSVPRSDISQVTGIYSGSQVKVTAIVKEDLTDVELRGSAVTTFRDTPYKVEILDNTPSVFKAGLPFSVFAKASMQDDTPVPEASTLTAFITVHYSIPSDNSYLYGLTSFTGTYPLPVQTLNIPPNGVVKIDVDIPSNATVLDVLVDFKGIRSQRQISKMFSPSNNYLQLSLLDQDLQSWQTARVEVKATESMGPLRYQILSRGVMYDAKVVDTHNQHLMVINIPLSPQLSPTAHIMAYYVRPDLEIVADSIAFNVEGVFENEVTIAFSTNMSEPHADLDVYLTADPDSVVNLLAVDQSVLLIKSGNDVTPTEVSDAVGTFDRGQAPSDSAFALSLSRMNIQQTMEMAGLHVYSDAQLQATSTPPPPTPHDPSIFGPDSMTTMPFYYTAAVNGMGPPMPGATMPVPGMFMPTTTASFASGAGSLTNSPNDQALQEVERVRNLFPETWLWLSQNVSSNGSVTVHTTVPDTITSWIATAFATNLETGLGITANSAKLTVFRSFFVSLTMPYSVIRGETAVIQASIFNYLTTDVSVLVTMPGSSQYTSVVIAADGSESMGSGDQERVVIVKSNDQAAVYFPIIPTSVGAINIEVSARSVQAADAVRRPLIVEAEGVPSEFSIPVFISLNPNDNVSFTQTFPVTVPLDVVDGSSRSRIKVTGDILGPSIDGLGNLLRMPTGCGEQNMINMAPDLYIANYLTTTGQMTPVMRDRIKVLLETGYQRELTYQRQDGAFSSFGNRDNAGSTWLTAFVLRVFHESRPYVFVDSGVLQRALDWVIQRQNMDGSFNEFGFIFDPEMRQFGDHSTGLTAFVLLALIENTDVPITTDGRNALGNATIKAREFLESSINNITDDLSLAITTLALTESRSPLADQAFEILMSHSITENGMTFWKVNGTTPANTYTRWQPPYVRARPIDIQITSYALLTYTARGMFEEGMSVLHWLTRQRNPYGGFASTQDTIVGLQAMTEFLQQAAPSGYDLHVDVIADSTSPHFDVNSTNALVLQSRELSYIPGEVEFRATGSGIAVAELDVFFNVESDFGEPAFDVSTVLMDDYLNSFKLMICTRWLLPGESGMVVQEVGIPSGFAPDMSSVGNVAGIKRVEQKGRFLDVYFDKVTKNSICYTVMFDRQDKVAHSQSSYVITQDYYEPNNRATFAYQSISLQEASVCDVCPDCCPRS